MEILNWTAYQWLTMFFLLLIYGRTFDITRQSATILRYLARKFGEFGNTD